MEEKKNNNRIIFIVLLVLGLILIGVGIYKLLIDKQENNSTPKPTVAPTIEPTITPESTITPEPTITPTLEPEITPEPKKEIKNRLSANTTFKSKDGKNTFIVNKIEHIEEDDESWYMAYVKFNGKKYTFSIYDDNYKYDKYLSLEGDSESDTISQCFSAAILLNLETNIIEKSNTKDHLYYDVIRSNSGYYFTEGYCLSGYDITIYSNNWKKLGRLVGSMADEDGNIYAFTNGKIIKYNLDGNEISETSTKSIYTGPGLIYNNTLYYLSTEKDATYLINNDTNEKVKVSDMKSKEYDSYVGEDANYITRLELNGSKISIILDGEKQSIYDINSKTLTTVK